MSGTKTGGGEHGTHRAKEYTDLLEKAMSQPGIQVVMAVYENWKRFDAAIQPHRQVMAVRRIVFKADPDRREKARDVANWLSSHGRFKSHSGHIPRSELEKKGLKIDYLERDQNLQDCLLSVFHATTHTFNGTSEVKIIENHLGKAFIKQSQALLVPLSNPQGLPQPPAPEPG
ncbi:MAG: hypothetical protein HY706_11745 [Candidatus Hydrogenedentes bacterium]|nr:hypothetical protein [Candidatus Hydrogenedentota bacterium]